MENFFLLLLVLYNYTLYITFLGCDSFKSFFSMTRTMFSQSRSEQFLKQNTIAQSWKLFFHFMQILIYFFFTLQESTICIPISSTTMWVINLFFCNIMSPTIESITKHKNPCKNLLAYKTTMSYFKVGMYLPIII